MTLSTPEFNARLGEALARAERRARALKSVERGGEFRYWRCLFPDAPSAAALHRHAERFGPDGVGDVRDAYDVKLRNVSAAPQSRAPRRRRTSESMKTKVLNLHERGVVPAAIADTLNITDRRVADILRAAA